MTPVRFIPVPLFQLRAFLSSPFTTVISISSQAVFRFPIIRSIDFVHPKPAHAYPPLLISPAPDKTSMQPQSNGLLGTELRTQAGSLRLQTFHHGVRCHTQKIKESRYRAIRSRKRIYVEHTAIARAAFLGDLLRPVVGYPTFAEKHPALIFLHPFS